MAVFRLTRGIDTPPTTFEDDVIVVRAGSHLAPGDVIAGGDGHDEIRFTAGSRNATLDFTGVVVSGIETVVLGSSSGSTAGRGRANVFAQDLAAGLDIIGNNGRNTLVGTADDDFIDGNGGNDLIDGFLGDDTLVGGTGNDTLWGGSGADTLLGGAGDDFFVLLGAAEYDAGETIDGGDGTDTLLYLPEADNEVLTLGPVSELEFVIVGSASPAGHIDASAVDQGIALIGNARSNILVGGDGDDTLAGDGGADLLLGGAGDDIFLLFSSGEFVTGEIVIGGDGEDVLLFSGRRNDTLVLQPGAVQVETVAADAGSRSALHIDAGAMDAGLSIIGNRSANSLTGSAFDDVIYGENGNDVIDGGAGNDTLVGGFGRDIIRGGEGDDVLLLQLRAEMARGELLDGGDGYDILRLESPVAGIILPVPGNMVSVEEIQLAGDATLGIDARRYGAGLVFHGNESTNVVLGSQGDDNISGGAGNDAMFGNGGDDSITGGDGTDTLSGGDGADFLDGGAGNDVFVMARTTEFTGDTLEGGAGNDVLRVLSGPRGDTLVLLQARFGGIEEVALANIAGRTTGRAAINVDASDLAAAIALTGNNGHNSLTGGAGDDVLTGNGGNDVLIGGDGDDVLEGGAGADVLIGGDGDDSLRGGGGVDRMEGGDGDDVFLFGAPGELSRRGSIDGGAGLDEVRFSGSRPNQTLTLPAGTTGIELVGVSSTLAVHINAAAVTETLTIVGNDAANRLTGGAGDDLMLGLGGNDVLTGNDGDDSMSGGAGADRLLGGAGDDLFVVVSQDELEGDVIDGGSGFDTLRLAPSGDAGFVLGPRYSGLERVTIFPSADTLAVDVDASAAAGPFTLVGNAGVNVLIGSRGGDALDGGAGDDTLDGGAGDDRILLRAGQFSGAERLDGGAGTDTLAFAGTAGLTVDFTALDDGFVTGIEVLDITGEAGGDNAASLQASDVLAMTGTGTLRVDGDAGDGLSLLGGNWAQGDATAIGGASYDRYTNGDATVLVAQQVTVFAGSFSGTDGDDRFIYRTLEDDAQIVDMGAGSDTLVVNAGSGALRLDFSSADHTPDLPGVYTGFENLDAAAADGALRVVAGAGSRFVATGSGDDSVDLAAGDNTVTTGAGADTVGGAVDAGDRVDLGAGDDRFSHSSLDDAANTVAGGSGIDTLVYGGALALVVDFSAADQVAAETGLYTGFENLDASAADGDVTVTAAATTTRVAFGAGDDSFVIGALAAGATVSGGAGTDTLLFAGSQFAADLTLEDQVLTGNGRFTGFENLDASAATGKVQFRGVAGTTRVLTGAGDDFVDLAAGANTALGDASVSTGDGADTVLGGDGDDIITGGGGADTVLGGNGRDTVLGGGGEDTLFGGGGDDSLDGGDGIDRLQGDDGADTLTGGADGDTLAGLAGNDTLSGGTGDDSLFGGIGDDSLDGGDDADYLQGDDGADTLTGGAGDDTLSGSAGNDALFGDSGADTLLGGTGDDSLSGGAGSDTLRGGEGADRLEGGADADFFVFGGGAGVETIVDFVSGEDRLVFSDAAFELGVDEGTGNATVQAFTAGIFGLVDAGFVQGNNLGGSADQRFGYNATTGELFFDLDGSGTTFGGLLIATLSGAPTLTEADLGYIA